PGHGDDQVGLAHVLFGELPAPVHREVETKPPQRVAGADTHGLVLDDMGAGGDDVERRLPGLEHGAGHDRARRVARAQHEDARTGLRLESVVGGTHRSGQAMSRSAGLSPRAPATSYW